MADAGKEQNWSKAMLLSQSGDALAYKKLLGEISDYLRAFLAKKFRDPAQLDDLLQEILIGIHKARHTYDGSRPFMPWLHAIVRFKSTDLLRKIYRDQRFEEWDADIHHGFDETFLPAETNEGLGETLQAALQKLPEKQRQIVELLKVDGLSVKEAAERTRMSESALKVAAHRAYKALRKSLTGVKDGS